MQGRSLKIAVRMALPVLTVTMLAFPSMARSSVDFLREQSERSGESITVPTIPNMELFLDRCPANDPAYPIIRNDFRIRKDGALVGEVGCKEPYTKLPLSEYSDELAVLQALRLVYYMDLGRTGYLPWSPLRMYDWMKAKIGGVNVSTTSTFSSCCFTFELFVGRPYITIGKAADDLNRQNRLTLKGVATIVALFGHETRHVDGFDHVSCCGLGNAACDQTYDEANLSPYGIQYFLYRLWLNGEVNLGYSCLDPPVSADVSSWFLDSGNGYLARFCDLKPKQLSMPATPGGVCTPGAFPHINPNGVTNAGSLRSDRVAQGGLISIFGTGFATVPITAVQTPLPTTLANTTLQINGNPVPLLFVGPGQINAQLPFEIQPGAATAQVVAGNDIGFTLSFHVNAASVGIFQYGDNRAVAQNEDSSLNGPDNPAKAGSIVTVYFTGQGPLDNPVPTGAPAPTSPLSRPAQESVVTIGDVRCELLFIGMTPKSVGLAQANVRVPSLRTGDYPIMVRVGDLVSNTPLISVIGN